MDKLLYEKAKDYLNELCVVIKDRSVGSSGNKKATEFFQEEISLFGWETEKNELNTIDWENSGVELLVNDMEFQAFVSPYSLGCNTEAELVAISNIDQLENTETVNKIVLLYGEIAKERLIPKNFIYFNLQEHKKIISLLENKGIKAIISATSRDSALSGGAYPFPLIDDGDFDIPSVYMTKEEGDKILEHVGKVININSNSKRIKTKSYNIVAKKGINSKKKIVVTAHIDAKKNVPGAIDNATGVIVLLLVAQLLKDYNGENLIEIVPLNGEDYYSVPGQIDYIERNSKNLGDIMLNINIDGAGYKEGESALSFYDVPDNIKNGIKNILNISHDITEGEQWPQGDHSIFIQNGIPAIAITSKWLTDNMYNQTITHTSKDNPEIVDCLKLVNVANVVSEIINSFEITK